MKRAAATPAADDDSITGVDSTCSDLREPRNGSGGEGIGPAAATSKLLVQLFLLQSFQNLP
jgi:hypothetical protein